MSRSWLGLATRSAECVVHLGRSYPHEDPSCSGPVPTAKTTLNPAHVRPERRALQNEPRLDDTITPRNRTQNEPRRDRFRTLSPTLRAGLPSYELPGGTKKHR